MPAKNSTPMRVHHVDAATVRGLAKEMGVSIPAVIGQAVKLYMLTILTVHHAQEEEPAKVEKRASVDGLLRGLIDRLASAGAKALECDPLAIRIANEIYRPWRLGG